jgi:hypothetical protein
MATQFLPDMAIMAAPLYSRMDMMDLLLVVLVLSVTYLIFSGGSGYIYFFYHCLPEEMEAK